MGLLIVDLYVLLYIVYMAPGSTQPATAIQGPETVDVIYPHRGEIERRVLHEFYFGHVVDSCSSKPRSDPTRINRTYSRYHKGFA